MQWSLLPNGGFSAADQPVRPVISAGEYSYQRVNVTDQRHDPHSLLAWFERMIHTLRESPEVGAGRCRPVDVKLPAGVLAHRADGVTGSMLFLHNLGTDDVQADLGVLASEADHPNQVFGDRDYGPVGQLDALEIGRYGYRWIRLRRTP
jgi:maltose alpha-D-glucosyltransferase/alpha-amylase